MRLQSHPNLHTKRSSIQSDIYQMSYDTINSPDDGHMAARNNKRTEINIHEKELCVRLVVHKEFQSIESNTWLYYLTI